MYILITKNYILATPDCFADSDRTQKIGFYELANDYELQCRLKLASCVLIKPLVRYADPLVGDELIRGVASYLSAFKNKIEDQNNVFNYLINNGELKILWVN